MKKIWLTLAIAGLISFSAFGAQNEPKSIKYPITTSVVK